MMAAKVSFGMFLTRRRKGMNHKRKRRWQRIGISKSAIVEWKIDGNYRPRQTIENIGDNKNNINTISKLFLWKTS